MKVDRNERFSPVVITIETEEELDALWHMVNVSNSSSIREYFQDNYRGGYAEGVPGNFKETSDFKVKLFVAIDQYVRGKDA
jgi:hypothetical protein